MAKKDRPAVVAAPTYRLSKEDLRKWWQVESFFKLGFREEASKFSSSTLKGQLSFLITLPVMAGLLIWYVLTGEQSAANMGAITQVIISISVPYLFFLFNFIDAMKHHMRLVPELQAFEDGIRLKSSFLQWRVTWEQVEEFYPVQNGNYVLKTKEHGEFVLPEELSNSSDLFALINMKAPHISKTYSISVRQPNEFLDSMQCASLAVVIAVALYVISSWPNIFELDVLLSVSLAIGACLWYWIHLNKFAFTIRFGDETFRVITKFSDTEYQWQQVLSVKKIGAYYFVKTRQGWFFTLPEKNSSLEAKLLDCRDNSAHRLT